MHEVNVTNEELAGMIKEGFDGVEHRLGKLEDDVKIVKSDVFDIKLRLDNTAARFEVRDLERRVEVLERK